MVNDVNLTPEVYHTITPLLKVKDSSKLIDFLIQIFGAKEINRYQQKDGKSVRIDIKIGNSIIMIIDSISELKPITGALYLYINDVDKIYQNAIKYGAISLKEPKDDVYGDRYAIILDQFGNQWWIASKENTKSEGEEFYNDSKELAESDQTFSI
jgi:PhnB protein